MDFPIIIVLVIILLAVLLSAFVFIKANKSSLTEKDHKFISKNWNSIINKANEDSNHAVLEADKLLNHVLKLRGIEGSVGEQLKSVPSLFSNINDVWRAHKARNQIAHEIGKQITPKQAKSYLNIYKKALKDLGAKI
jgi:multidrug efflux pump subunit AcrB